MIPALISGASALAVCIISNLFQSQASKEQHDKTTALIEYRIDELTRKVEKHNRDQIKKYCVYTTKDNMVPMGGGMPPDGDGSKAAMSGRDLDCAINKVGLSCLQREADKKVKLRGGFYIFREDFYTCWCGNPHICR